MGVFDAFMHPRGYGGKIVPKAKPGPKPKKPPKEKQPPKPKAAPKGVKASSKTSTNKVARGSVPKGAKVKTPTDGKRTSGLTAVTSVTNVRGGGWGSSMKGGGSGASAAAGGEQAIAQNAQLGAVQFLSSKPSQH
jgi:outer membrane biosynthesis protein TonB